MNLFDRLEKKIQKTTKSETVKSIQKESDQLSQEEIELAIKLDAIEEFTIDRFEEDVVVLENRKTQEIINLKKEELPEGVKTGDILKKINGKFLADKAETKKVENRIKRKMNHLWN